MINFKYKKCFNKALFLILLMNYLKKLDKGLSYEIVLFVNKKFAKKNWICIGLSDGFIIVIFFSMNDPISSSPKLMDSSFVNLGFVN